MSNSYIIKLERLRAELETTLRSRFITVTSGEELDTLIPKVRRIGHWEQDDQTTPDYVSDGLIAMYDGIKNTRNGHNDKSLYWEDLSGNDIDLEIQVPYATNWKSDALQNTINNGGARTTATITTPAHVEIVVRNYRNSGWSVIATFNNLASRLIQYSSDGLHPIESRRGYLCEVWKRNSASFDYVNGKYKINGQDGAIGTLSDSWASRNSNCSINLFRYGNETSYWVCGEICSLRLYDRSLTDEEVAHNFAIDRVRFGIETESEVV